jgi:hypothetical protein
MRSLRTIAVAVLLVATNATNATDAKAEEKESIAAATALFDEAVALMDKGKYSEACPKLVKSQEIAPSGGTLLALGECYERTGRNASAWLAFREAAARAAAAGKKDAENAALERASRIAASMSRLTIRVTEAATMQGVEVRRDGIPLKAAEIGAASPLDPGTHVVEAVAPGHRTWTARVVLASSGNTEVTVPPLELVAPGQENTPPPPPPAPEEPSSSRRTIGLLVAGGGLAFLGVGTAFGIMAGSTNAEALDNCNTQVEPTRCTQRGLDLTDDARTQAFLSTIFVIAGGAAVVGGTVLFVTAPVKVAPTASTTGGGLSATVRF